MMKLKHLALAVGLSIVVVASAQAADQAAAQSAAGQGKKPNIVIIWGDDIGPACATSPSAG